MTADRKQQILDTLREVHFPGRNRDIVGFGMVPRVAECDGVATVELAVGHLDPKTRDQLTEAVREALDGLEFVERSELQVVEPSQQGEAREGAKEPRPPCIIAVGSGKGGVGKSTVAANLAVGFAQEGWRVGLMDADVYGPSLPRMLGVDAMPSHGSGRIHPAEVHGVKMVSLGFMVDPSEAVVWRGPMTGKVIRQFLGDVAWGDPDVLVVDLPPSTGDVAISLAKMAEPDGAVVVTTPQSLSVDDVRRALAMFDRLEIDKWGLVENMASFVCDDCGKVHHPFGSGGGHDLAAEADVPFLGEIPMEALVQQGGDGGTPVVADPSSPAGEALRAMAATLSTRIARQVERARQAPA